jgi:hypothetical protein
VGYLFDGTTDGLHFNFSGSVLLPINLSIWFYSSSGQSGQQPIGIEDDTNTAQNQARVRLDFADPDRVYTLILNRTGGATSVSGGDWGDVTNVWTHLFARFSTTRMDVYENGVQETGTTHSEAPQTEHFVIGNRWTGGTPSNFMDGRLAEAAMWTGADMDDRYALQLAAGVSPLQIRPDLLAHYWPLRDSFTDIVGDWDLSEISGSSLVKTDHPPVSNHFLPGISPSIPGVDEAAARVLRFGALRKPVRRFG